MPAKRYHVVLTPAQRQTLTRIVKTGAHKAFARQRAQIWLQADAGAEGPGRKDQAVATGLGVGVRTVERARRAWCTAGLEAGLQTAPMDHVRTPPVLDGKGEARLVALACGDAPEGYARWTHQRLADTRIAEGVVPTVSASTVGRVLKKTP